MSSTSPYESITPESIKAEILQDIAQQGRIDVREGSYTNTLISGVSYRLWLLYQQLGLVPLAAIPDATCGEYIDNAAAVVGLTRKTGTVAGVVVTFYGTDGTQIPAGTVLYAPESGLRYQTTEGAQIAAGSAQAPAVAAAEGAQYNLPAGSISALYESHAGVSSVTNLAAASGGTDPEGDEAFWTRYRTKTSMPATSGNANQYILWALEVDGVTYAQCIPVWDGPGTVKVIVAADDKLPVDNTVLQECAAHLEANRLVDAQLTTTSVVQRRLDLTATVKLAAGATIEGVAAQLTQAVNELLAEQPFGTEVAIPYSKFLIRLLNCDGVADYTAFTVDGGTNAITLTAEEVGLVGVVTVQ